MPKILNTSARNIIVMLAEGHVIERHEFPPAKLVTVKPELWKKMLKVKMVKNAMDSGEFVEGAAASRDAIDGDDVVDDLKSDLTDQEQRKLVG